MNGPGISLDGATDRWLEESADEREETHYEDCPQDSDPLAFCACPKIEKRERANWREDHAD